MAEKIHLEIVTPEKLVLNQDVNYVMATGVCGEFGVMPGHTPFMTALKIGALNYEDDHGVEHSVFVNRGFAEVLPNKVTILAESAELREKIDLNRAELARQRAETRIADAKTNKDIDLDRAEWSLQRAIVRLNLGAN